MVCTGKDSDGIYVPAAIFTGQLVNRLWKCINKDGLQIGPNLGFHLSVE